jgi:hypothetical protein
MVPNFGDHFDFLNFVFLLCPAGIGFFVFFLWCLGILFFSLLTASSFYYY